MTTNKTTLLSVKPEQNSMLDKLRQEVIEFNKFRKEVMKIYQEQISFSEQISAAVVQQAVVNFNLAQQKLTFVNF